MTDLDRLIRPEEAARMLGMHVKTLTNWDKLEQPGPKAIRVGQRREKRYRLGDILAWIEKWSEKPQKS